MILARFATLAAVSLLIGGGVTACARRAANSVEPDDIKLLTTARLKWEASIQAKSAGSVEPFCPACEAAVGPQTNAQSLIEAAQFGDAKLVESLLARGVGRAGLYLCDKISLIRAIIHSALSKAAHMC